MHAHNFLRNRRDSEKYRLLKVYYNVCSILAEEGFTTVELHSVWILEHWKIILKNWSRFDPSFMDSTTADILVCAVCYFSASKPN